METSVLLYASKVNIALLLIYGIYALFLRKDTFFTLNRFYFLVGILVSLLYPFFVFELTPEYTSNQTVRTFFYYTNLDTVTVNGIQHSEKLINWPQILLIAIFALSALFILRLLIQSLSIARMAMKYPKTESILGSQIRKVTDNEISPFSFFKWIFINPQLHTTEDLTDIVMHEKVHAEQYHSVDVLMVEFLCAIFWWNPIVWVLKKDLRLNLEYIADSSVLENGADAKKYQYHLVKLSYGKAAAIINNFNVLQLKKRILMMNKERSIKYKQVKFLFIFPAVFLLIAVNCLFVACSSNDRIDQIEPIFQEQSKNEGNVTEKQENTEVRTQDDIASDTEKPFVVVEQMPEFPGGTDALMKYIMDNLKYPVDAVEKGIEGRVIIQFVVSKTGEIGNIEIIRGLHPSCDQEGLRVIKAMPNWKPGKQKGEAVPVFFTFPIQFKLRK